MQKIKSKQLNTNYISPYFTISENRSKNPEIIKFIIIHYTNLPLASTLGIFSNNKDLLKQDFKYFDQNIINKLKNHKASSHYSIDLDGTIYQHVPEEYIAHHAGNSKWGAYQNLNQYSIGIELIHVGETWLKDYPQDNCFDIVGSENLNIDYKNHVETIKWRRFEMKQIAALIDLCKYLIKKYNINLSCILGHSDVACGRKFDPGPMFPWEYLASNGIGIWPQSYIDNIAEFNTSINSMQKLKALGYDSDLPDSVILSAFQMHFRPNNIDGILDNECKQIINALYLQFSNKKINI